MGSATDRLIVVRSEAAVRSQNAMNGRSAANCLYSPRSYGQISLAGHFPRRLILISRPLCSKWIGERSRQDRLRQHAHVFVKTAIVAPGSSVWDKRLDTQCQPCSAGFGSHLGAQEYCWLEPKTGCGKACSVQAGSGSHVRGSAFNSRKRQLRTNLLLKSRGKIR
jgi:hypothetical protein